MDDVHVVNIRRDAFCAMNIQSIRISNATIDEIETAAFTDRIHIFRLEFSDVTFKVIRKGALKAGVDNLTVQFSRSVN